MNNVELLLTNGKKILMSNFDLSKVYDVIEITKSKLFFFFQKISVYKNYR